MTTPISTKITDQQVAAVRAMIGVVRRPAYESWQMADAVIRRSTIRTWAVVNGDMRPLYTDPDHAARSPWGTIIAPPAMLTHYEQINPETDVIPGAFSTLQSAVLNFVRPIRMGDTVMSESEIKSVTEVSSGAKGRVIEIAIETRVTDNKQQPFGTATLAWALYERGSQAQRELFGNRQDGHIWSREDIEALGAEYKLEKQRGADTLYWDDVRDGEELQHLLKGPTTRSRHIDRTNSTWYWGHKQAVDEMQQHPERFFTNENGALEPVMATDWVHHRAQRWGGLPGALEVAADRPHYLAECLANWMGDAGFPSRMDLKFPKQNMIGDVTRSYGRVTGKRKEGGKGIVSLAVWQKNQLDETISEGTAEVILPTR